MQDGPFLLSIYRLPSEPLGRAAGKQDNDFTKRKKLSLFEKRESVGALTRI